MGMQSRRESVVPRDETGRDFNGTLQPESEKASAKIAARCRYLSMKEENPPV